MHSIDIHKELSNYFGFSEFRLGQEEIIHSILKGRDTLAVMPTGGGKSLCYQLPAILLEGTAIVVSPLIALMKDQVDALDKIGIPATFINSSLSLEELKERVNLAIQGHFKLLYVAPERLENEYFMKILNMMRISFLAVDEAHCISEWGHDFRPAYMNISKALEARPIKPVAAFTATAGPQVQEDIIRILSQTKCNRFIKGFDRPNLSYIAIEDMNKLQNVAAILKKTKVGSSIIYCGSRKKVDDFTFQLDKMGFNVAGYHAGLLPAARKSVQEDFINGTKPIIVATNAFGMGIDKSDVRNVIHCDFTGTLEAYYQEAGRAGRDGNPSNCYLIYHYSDLDLQEYFISCRFPEKSDMERLYGTLQFYADEYHQVKLSGMLLANYSGLPEAKVNAILDIFERKEIVERSNQSSRAKIKFNCNRDGLVDYYQKTSTERRDTIAAIMRMLSADVFENYLDLDLKALFRKHAISEQQFHETIRALKYSNLVDFKPEQAGTGLAVLSGKTPFAKLQLDLPELEKRKKVAKQKLDVVMRYAETLDCKRNYILEYFQDDEVQGECGKCSSCTSSKKSKVGKVKGDMALKTVLNGLMEINLRFGKILLVDFLRGEDNAKTKKFKLSNFEYFGALSDYSDYDVKHFIEKAIGLNFIKISAGLYPILSLTKNGLLQIAKSSQVAKIETDESEQNLLYEKLKAVRYEIAKGEGILERAVASDRSLRQMALNPPSSMSGLAKVEGMGKYIIDKYGRIFLAAVSDELAEEFEQAPAIEINPTTARIAELFQDGKKIDDIAETLELDKGSIARITQNAIINGEIDLDWALFVNQKEYDKIKQTVYRKPHITLKHLRQAITFDIDFAILRIVSAIARHNL